MSGDDGRPPTDDSTPEDDAESDAERSPADESTTDEREWERDPRDVESKSGESEADMGPKVETTDATPESNGGTPDATAHDDGPLPTHAARRGRADGNPLQRFLNAQHGPYLFAREVVSSVGVVVAVGLLLFAISGVWPPMVAVESGSMEPHMYRGDLIFITKPGRLMPADATVRDTGVVTYERGEEAGYRTLGSYGSVVVYDNPNNFGPPIIHRARFWVDDGENWYDRANPDYVNAGSCEQLSYCPAPHAGFITKGDANPGYDQAMRISGPVKPEWVTGTARLRVPYLGWIRLFFTEGFAAVTDGSGPIQTMPMQATTASTSSMAAPFRAAVSA